MKLAEAALALLGLVAQTALTLLALAALAGARESNDARPIAFDIPAQRLTRSLQELAQQAELQILFVAEAVKARRAPALAGRMSVEAALDVLLEGSDLEHVRNGDTVVVRRRVPETTQEITALASVADGVHLGEALVTGTHIRGAASMSPLIVFDRESIERSGVSTTRQMLATLPQNFGGGDNEGTSASPGGSHLNVALGSSINLRGLGSDASLVLVNGHRVAPAAFGQFVDVSLIPLSAIERVEILADGASATYGSDAVGGVVNFILREATSHDETELDGGLVTHGDLDEVHISQTLSGAGARARGMLVYDYTDRSNLDAAERPYASAVSGPFDLLPSQKTHSLLANARADLSERTVLTATALASRRDARWRILDSVSGDPTVFPASARQLSAALGADMALTGPWGVELDATYSRNDTRRDVMTETQEGGQGETGERNELDIVALDAKLDGALARWQGGELTLAFGLHGRRERYEQGGINHFRNERDVVALFGELGVPLGRNLELFLAARHEHSSDFGRVTIPKLGLSWSGSRDLRLRATYGRSFRAPALGEFNDSNASALLYAFPDPAAPDGTTLALLLSGNSSALAPEQARTWTLGLDWQLPIAGTFELGLTFFDTAFADRIVEPLPGVEVLSIFGNTNAYASLIQRHPAPQRVRELAQRYPFVNGYGDYVPEDVEALIDRRLQNISATDVSGIDLIAEYQLPGALSACTFELNASWLLEYANALTRNTPAHEVVDTAFHPSDFRARGGVSWQLGAFTATASFNYLDDSTNTTVTPYERIGSWSTFDVGLAYQAHDSVWEGVRVALSVFNALDATPPRVSFPAATVPLGFDPTNADALGRFVSLGLTKSW